MSSNDFLNGLAAIGKAAMAYNSILNLAENAFISLYGQMDVQLLIHNAVCSAMSPAYFSQYTINLFEEDSPLLMLGAETLVAKASECLWKVIRERNLEITVLTVFQQGLSIAQKNCRY